METRPICSGCGVPQEPPIALFAVLQLDGQPVAKICETCLEVLVRQGQDEVKPRSGSG